MSRGKKKNIFLTLFVLVGIPLVFLVISLMTGNWGFFVYSIAPSFSAGIMGLILIYKEKSGD